MIKLQKHFMDLNEIRYERYNPISIVSNMFNSISIAEVTYTQKETADCYEW